MAEKQKTITARTLKHGDVGVLSDSTVPNLQWHLGKDIVSASALPWVNGKQERVPSSYFGKIKRTATLKDFGAWMAEVRVKVKDIKDRAAHGAGPKALREEARRKAEEARQEAARRQRNTFLACAEKYFKLEQARIDRGDPDKISKDELDERRRKVKVDLEPLHGRPVNELLVRDYKDIFDTKGNFAHNRLHTTAALIVDLAVLDGLVDFNAVRSIPRRPEPSRRDYLHDPEIYSFWHNMPTTGLDPVVQRILKALLVTMRRRKEVRLMRWSELKFDKDRWEIPAEGMKRGQEQWVPLTPLLLELIGENNGHDFVFAKKDGQPFSPYTVTQGMRREKETLGLTRTRLTPHDLRRTGSTKLSEMGVSEEVCGLLLAHSSRTVTGRVYTPTPGKRWQDRVNAANAWDSELQRIIHAQPAPSNVEPLRVAK